MAKTEIDEMVDKLTKAYNNDGGEYVLATSIKGADKWDEYSSGSMGFRIDVICELISDVFERIPSREVCGYVNGVISEAVRREVEKFNKREAADNENSI